MAGRNVERPHLYVVTDNPPPEPYEGLRSRLNRIVEKCWYVTSPEFPGVEMVRETAAEIQEDAEAIIDHLPENFYGVYKGQVICKKGGMYALYYREATDPTAQWNYNFDSIEEIYMLIDSLSN